MDLNGRQRKALRKGIQDAFGFNGLKLLVSEYMNEQLDNIVLDGDYPHRIHELILWADRRGRTTELVNVARERRPRHQGLAELAEELGLTSTGTRIIQPIEVSEASLAAAGGTFVKPDQFNHYLRTVDTAGQPAKIDLQRVVQERGAWINLADFFPAANERERQVCRIVIPGGGGTGFLVAADLVLTNHHVMKPVIDNSVSIQNVYCHFDYHETADDQTVSDGRQVKLAAEWLVHSSPPSPSDEVVGGPDPVADHCDYALVRLAEEIGNEPAGPPTEDPDAEARGWVPVGDPPIPAAAGHEVFIFQHPKKKPILFTIGRVLGFNTTGNRLRHDANTASGSSGSPCFNAKLELIALHHAGDPDFDSDHRPEYNQAVPLLPILDLLKQTAGVPHFWTP